MQRRFRSAPTAWWAWACIAIFISGAFTLLGGNDPGRLIFGHAAATLYPALLLAGALRYVARDVPLWLPAGAVLLGAARGYAQLQGHPELAQGAALAFEPGAIVVAARLMARADHYGPPTWIQRLVAPALLAMAALEVAAAVASFGGALAPHFVVGGYIFGAPALLAFQLVAWSETSRRELERIRQLLEERVAEQTERYRAVSELSSDFSFGCQIAPGGYLRSDWMTDAVTGITGYDSTDFEDRGWFDVVHPEDRGRLERELGRYFKERDERDSIDTRILTRQGDVRWLNLRFGAVQESADGTLRLVGAARDVTDRVRAEEAGRRLDLRMREMQRLESLGRLAGGIAHDFNNVLTVILGNVKLALQELDRGIPERRRLERIRAAAEYAAGLTEQVLTYSGKAAVALEPIDLSALVSELLDLLRASVSKKTVIEAHLPEALPAIEGDVTQLRQLLLNLVVNASDAMAPDGGTVRVRTGARGVDEEDLAELVGGPNLGAGHYVFLQVSDDGAGMDPEVRARIFDPFFTTKASGRGLGLAAVLGIVRAHRGRIRIDSTPLRGTSFEVLLPRSARRVAAPARETRAVAAEPITGGVILVVDDDEAVLEVGCEFLQRAGFEVRTAGSGREALEIVRASGDGIDAVVLDLVMPDLSGEETFLALRDLHPELPVVLASGYDREQAASRFSARGVADFLRKPFEPEDLLASVQRVLTLGR